MKRATKIDAKLARYERRATARVTTTARGYRHGDKSAARMLELFALARQQGADVDAAVSLVLDRALASMKAGRGDARWAMAGAIDAVEGLERVRRRLERDERAYKPSKRALTMEINKVGLVRPGPTRNNLASLVWSVAVAHHVGADVRVAVERLLAKVWRRVAK